MNLQHLRYFLTLADLEHYTEAAKQHHITQPTLSHAISALEEEVKIPLFVKKGRNIVLTDAGRDFYQTVHHSVSILDQGIIDLQKKNLATTKINLALLHVLGRNAVPNLVRHFMEDQADTDVQFDFHNDSGMSYDMVEGLLDDRYDLVFCSKLDHFPTISYLPMFAQDLVLIVPKGHNLSQQEKVTLEDTVQYPQVWFSKRSGMRPVLEKLFQDITPQPKRAFEVSEDETIIGLVAQWFGIAIVPDFDFLKNSEDIDIIRLEELKDARIYYAAYRNDKELAPAVSQFIDYIATSSHEHEYSI